MSCGTCSGNSKRGPPGKEGGGIQFLESDCHHSRGMLSLMAIISKKVELTPYFC